MPRKAGKIAKKAADKRTRKVQYRFRGIDRSLSKAVYALESRLALTQRQLNVALKLAKRSTLIDEEYQRLTPGNRRRLLEQAKLLRAVQK